MSVAVLETNLKFKTEASLNFYTLEADKAVLIINDHRQGTQRSTLVECRVPECLRVAKECLKTGPALVSSNKSLNELSELIDAGAGLELRAVRTKFALLQSIGRDTNTEKEIGLSIAATKEGKVVPFELEARPL